MHYVHYYYYIIVYFKFVGVLLLCGASFNAFVLIEEIVDNALKIQ